MGINQYYMKASFYPQVIPYFVNNLSVGQFFTQSFDSGA